MSVELSPDHCRVVEQASGTVVVSGTLVSDPYQLDCKSQNGHSRLEVNLAKHEELLNSAFLWHCKLGHPNMERMKEVLSKSELLYKDEVKFSAEKSFECEACIMSKTTNKSTKNKDPNRAQQLLQTIHTDLCGPMSTTSLGGANYFMAVVDDWSRYTKTYFLQHKAQALEMFKDYVQLAQTLIGKKLITLRTDNGGEFISNKFHNFCKEQGISRQFTVLYSSSQNPLVEVKNRHIQEGAKALLQQSGLPRKS